MLPVYILFYSNSTLQNNNYYKTVYFSYPKPLLTQFFHYFKALILFSHTSQVYFVYKNPSTTVHFSINFITFKSTSLIMFCSHSHACGCVFIFILFCRNLSTHNNFRNINSNTTFTLSFTIFNTSLSTTLLHICL